MKISKLPLLAAILPLAATLFLAPAQLRADTYNVVVDASDVAAYNDGTTMVSAFQRDQSLFRVIAEHDVNMRHLQSLVVLLTQDWAFSGVPGSPGAPYSTQPLNPTWSQAPAVRPALATGANAPPTLTDPA